MFLLLGLVLLCDCGRTAVVDRTAATYDQRQTGDVNVQVQLKDVQILALLDAELFGDYTEYDYAYDYADFTIKPIGKPTTDSPLSTSSIEPWYTWPTNSPSTEGTTAKSNATEVAAPAVAQNQSSTVETADAIPTTESVAPQNPADGETAPIRASEPASISANDTAELLDDNKDDTVNEKNSDRETLPALDDADSSPSETTTAGVKLKTRINDKAGNLSGEEDILKITKDEGPPAETTATAAATSTQETATVAQEQQQQQQQHSTKRCQPGYTRGKKRRCRRPVRRRIPFLPITMGLTQGTKRA